MVVVAGAHGLAALVIRWQNQRLQAEMAAVPRATRAKMARSFAESQAVMAERQRQWALQQQLRDLEQQIREEAMSEKARAWHHQWRQ
jgi:hypothetical protein